MDVRDGQIANGDPRERTGRTAGVDPAPPFPAVARDPVPLAVNHDVRTPDLDHDGVGEVLDVLVERVGPGRRDHRAGPDHEVVLPLRHERQRIAVAGGDHIGLVGEPVPVRVDGGLREPGPPVAAEVRAADDVRAGRLLGVPGVRADLALEQRVPGVPDPVVRHRIGLGPGHVDAGLPVGRDHAVRDGDPADARRARPQQGNTAHAVPGGGRARDLGVAGAVEIDAVVDVVSCRARGDLGAGGVRDGDAADAVVLGRAAGYGRAVSADVDHDPRTGVRGGRHALDPAAGVPVVDALRPVGHPEVANGHAREGGAPMHLDAGALRGIDPVDEVPSPVDDDVGAPDVDGNRPREVLVIAIDRVGARLRDDGRERHHGRLGHADPGRLRLRAAARGIGDGQGHVIRPGRRVRVARVPRRRRAAVAEGPVPRRRSPGGGVRELDRERRDARARRAVEVRGIAAESAVGVEPAARHGPALER